MFVDKVLSELYFLFVILKIQLFIYSNSSKSVNRFSVEKQ